MKKQYPMEDQIEHLRSLPRAKPPEGLYKKIEARIGEAKTVALADWRSFAAAAVLLAVINVATLMQYAQVQPGTDAGVAAVENPLVSDYQLYY